MNKQLIQEAFIFIQIDKNRKTQLKANEYIVNMSYDKVKSMFVALIESSNEVAELKDAVTEALQITSMNELSLWQEKHRNKHDAK